MPDEYAPHAAKYVRDLKRRPFVVPSKDEIGEENARDCAVGHAISRIAVTA
jgi:hypothetical protein